MDIVYISYTPDRIHINLCIDVHTDIYLLTLYVYTQNLKYYVALKLTGNRPDFFFFCMIHLQEIEK